VIVGILRGDGRADIVGEGGEGGRPVELGGVCCEVDFVAAGGEGGAEFDDGCWRVMSIEFLTLEKRGKRYQRGCSRLQ
jgi:hypothetical protein